MVCVYIVGSFFLLPFLDGSFSHVSLSLFVLWFSVSVLLSLTQYLSPAQSLAQSLSMSHFPARRPTPPHFGTGHVLVFTEHTPGLGPSHSPYLDIRLILTGLQSSTNFFYYLILHVICLIKLTFLQLC